MVAFDPFEPGFVESPYGQYARLRAEDPVHWSDLLQGWVLTRHDDVVALLRDPDISVELRQRPAEPRRRPAARAPGPDRAQLRHARAPRRPRPQPAPQAAAAPLRPSPGRGAAGDRHRAGRPVHGRPGGAPRHGRDRRLRLPASGGGVQRDAGPARRGRPPGPRVDRGGGADARPRHRRRRARPLQRAHERDVRLPRRADRGQAAGPGRRRAHRPGAGRGGRRSADPRRAGGARSSRCTWRATSPRCR